MNHDLDSEIESQILTLINEVYSRYHYDFSEYSKSSLARRLKHASVVFNCESISKITEKLQREPEFFPRLLSYLTVNTTEFFRDPSYYLSLKKNVFPTLKTFPSIKVWIAGCSTGEELYSMAILLRESGIKNYMIYATDINLLNLLTAQKGIYNFEVLNKASVKYRQAGGALDFSQYYDEAYGVFKFTNDLLKNVVFADHSLSTDSVFSEMQLISCRNVLIYFQPNLQNRVISLFKDSLAEGGFMGLGSKESIQFLTSKKFFNIIDQDNRIYKRNNS